jgi:hypothetical protein
MAAGKARFIVRRIRPGHGYPWHVDLWWNGYVHGGANFRTGDDALEAVRRAFENGYFLCYPGRRFDSFEFRREAQAFRADP